MADVFANILARGSSSGQIAGKTRQSREWFRGIASNVSKSSVKPDKLLKTSKNKRSDVEPGKMYHYFYDPKGKDILPYYDKFPLIFMVGPASNGFYGINLHYLPIKLRAHLMDALYDVANNNKYDDSTKLEISYNIMKSSSKMKYFKPCFKRYLSSHVQSQFIEIPANQWDIALLLPTQRFQKASSSKVWSESRKMI